MKPCCCYARPLLLSDLAPCPPGVSCSSAARFAALMARRCATIAAARLVRTCPTTRPSSCRRKAGRQSSQGRWVQAVEQAALPVGDSICSQAVQPDALCQVLAAVIRCRHWPLLTCMHRWVGGEGAGSSGATGTMPSAPSTRTTAADISSGDSDS